MRGRRQGLALVVVAAVAACGNGQPTTSGPAVELSQRVQQVRAAAGAGDVDTARDRLAELRTAVEDLRTRGEITDDDAARIGAATTEVDQGLDLLTTTTTASTTAPAPPPTGESDSPDPPRSDPSADDDDDDTDGKDDRKKGRPKDGGGQGRGRG